MSSRFLWFMSLQLSQFEKLSCLLSWDLDDLTSWTWHLGPVSVITGWAGSLATCFFYFPSFPISHYISGSAVCYKHEEVAIKSSVPFHFRATKITFLKSFSQAVCSMCSRPIVSVLSVMRISKDSNPTMAFHRVSFCIPQKIGIVNCNSSGIVLIIWMASLLGMAH